MKVLLDECVDRRLAKELIGHNVTTVAQKLVPRLLAELPLAKPGQATLIGP